MPAKKERAASRLVKMTILVVPFVLFAGLMEMSLRWYFRTHTFYDVEMARYANALKVESPNPLIGHVHRAGSSMHVMDVDVKINSDGFRDDEYATGRSDKRRIVVLGDSLTFGWGVEMERSFEHLLEREFDSVSPTELINFGTGNYNTTQQLNLFKEKGLEYEPDDVFLFYFINDAEPIPEKSRYAWLARFRIATFFWSRIKALLAKKTPSDGFQVFYTNLYREDQPGWLQTKASFVDLKEICESHGISLKVVILPELHSLVDYPFKAEHAALSAHLSEYGIEHLDLTPNFQDQTNPSQLWVARDDAHPNSLAHKLIADFSYPFLSE